MCAPPSTSLAPDKNLSILRENNIASYHELIEIVFHQNMECFQGMLKGSGLPSSYYDDIISNVWEAAVNKIHTVRYNRDEDPIITASRWLYGVCRNKIKDKWQALAKERKFKERAAQAIDKAAQTQSDFLEEIQDILETALQSLRPKHRKLINDIHLEGRSYKELQGELGGTVNQLKSCCYYARQKWREKVIQLAKRQLRLTPEWDEQKLADLHSLIDRLT